MKSKSTIIALAIWLSFISLACSKSGGSAGNMSNDDRHRLYQAVGMTKDPALALEVMQRMGLVDPTGKPTQAMEPFLKEHNNWAMKNADFVNENSDPERAKAYVKSHLP